MIGAPSRGGVVLVMLLLFIAATLATLPICVQCLIESGVGYSPSRLSTPATNSRRRTHR